MAEANTGDKGDGEKVVKNKAGAGFKLNAEAPEFVPRCHSQVAAQPAAGFFHPWYGFIGSDGLLGSEWFPFVGQEPLRLSSINGVPSNSIDPLQKIVKQVEFQLSNTCLSSNDTLMKLMTKDPEGYVPISAVTSWKKIRSLGGDPRMLATALRASPKLVVSEDGNKVKRKPAFSERDTEELQSRTVVAENLPEDHSRVNLEKIFGVAGSIKNIRICRPQESNAAKPSKGDILISNKLHALVEYETAEQAEKAVERLNDERNWRKGLRVRMMLRRTPRSVIRGRKTDYDPFDANTDDEEDTQQPSEPSGSSQPLGPPIENLIEENPGVGRKWWAVRGRGKPRGGAAAQIHNGRGLLSPYPQAPRSPRPPPVDGARGILSSPSSQPTAGVVQPEAPGKNNSPRGPRMPDGTRGFTMGRGKPAGASP